MLPLSSANFAEDYIGQSAAALELFRADSAQIDLLLTMTDVIVQAIRAGGQVLFVGNGGSAGDAQHLAAEFTGRMLYDRDPLPALALHCDTSALTAIGNDYGFDLIFERQVRALGRPGDILVALSTSGNSRNVLCAIEAAKSKQLVTMGLTGQGGGAMAAECDYVLRAPSALTPVIQQIHMIAGHLLCALVERAMFPR